jgi:hypothetical protein
MPYPQRRHEAIHLDLLAAGMATSERARAVPAMRDVEGPSPPSGAGDGGDGPAVRRIGGQGTMAVPWSVTQ